MNILGFRANLDIFSKVNKKNCNYSSSAVCPKNSVVVTLATLRAIFLNTFSVACYENIPFLPS